MTTQTEILAAIENAITEFGRLGSSGAPRHLMIPEVAAALQALKVAHHAQRNYISKKENDRSEAIKSMTFTVRS